MRARVIWLSCVLVACVLRAYHPAGAQLPQPRTTIDAELALRTEVATVEGKLNEARSHLGMRLSERQRESLARADAAWIRYRDDNCGVYAAIYEEGTIVGVAVLNCRVRMTQERLRELRAIEAEITR